MTPVPVATASAVPAPAQSAGPARLSDPAAEPAIAAACRMLHLPTVRAEAGRIAEAAARERLTHRAYLADVLAAECDDRESRRRARRIHEARFPRTKRLDEFDLTALPGLTPGTLAHLAGGGWIQAGEPVVLLGDSGTGKSHLLIGLGIAAAEAGRRVRYVTTAALVNELAEAADDRQLTRVIGRYARLDLLCLDLCRPRHSSMRSATCTWTHGAPSSSFRSSPSGRNAPQSPAPATPRSAKRTGSRERVRRGREDRQIFRRWGRPGGVYRGVRRRLRRAEACSLRRLPWRVTLAGSRGQVGRVDSCSGSSRTSSTESAR